LSDVRYHITLIQRFVEGLQYEQFAEDLLRFHAVTRCLEIISEASRRLPDELKARHPAVAWQQMAGAGNIYRHDYEDVAASYVWVTVQDHLPALLSVVEHELAGFGFLAAETPEKFLPEIERLAREEE
jgi:uncharacterized protein with HEPN domain